MQVTGFVDAYPVPLKQAEIDVTLSWLERRLGKSLTPDDVKKKMELLGYQVTFDGDNMHVVVPTWRSTRRRQHQGRHHGGSGPHVRLREL